MLPILWVFITFFTGCFCKKVVDAKSFKRKLQSLAARDAVVGFDDSISEEMARDIYYNVLSSQRDINNTLKRIGNENRRSFLDSSGNLDDTDRQTLLDIHNDYRSSIASRDGTVIDKDGNRYPKASNMNSLFWDDALASLATSHSQDMADKCGSWFHNSDRHSTFYNYGNLASFEYPSSNSNQLWIGENVAVTWTTSKSVKWSYYQDRLDDMWDEDILWSYQKYDSNNNGGAGHFTQMAWAKTRYIGCGVDRCNDGTYYRYFLTCNFYPGGNVQDEYPYKTGSCTSNNNKCDGDRTDTCSNSLCSGCMDPQFTTKGSTNGNDNCENGLGKMVGSQAYSQDTQLPTNRPTTMNPTTKPTNKPTNVPTDNEIGIGMPQIETTTVESSEYTYCCNPTHSFYDSDCWPLATQSDCNAKRRVCQYKADNCKFNFECTKRGNSCNSNSECCSKSCRNRRGSKTCS